jgi:hypothetical protein
MHRRVPRNIRPCFRRCDTPCVVGIGEKTVWWGGGGVGYDEQINGRDFLSVRTTFERIIERFFFFPGASIFLGSIFLAPSCCKDPVLFGFYNFTIPPLFVLIFPFPFKCYGM